jgi:hypothetical protein
MCNHKNVRHVTPKGITPKYSDNLSMDFWDCPDCGETFDHNPKEEDDEVIDERKIMRDSLFH